MPSAFDALLGSADAAFDATFGRPFRLRPRTKGNVNARSGVDNARSEATFVAILEDYSRLMDVKSSGLTEFSRQSLGRQDTTPRLSVAHNVLAPLAWRIGDHVLDVERGGLYEITGEAPDDGGRTWLVLAYLKREASP